MATTAGLASYLRLLPDDSEDLTLYLNAAKAKAAAAGIPELENNDLYDLFLYALAAFYYDNRGMTFAGTYQGTAEENARRLINSFVLTLRYSEVPDGEGS